MAKCAALQCDLAAKRAARWLDDFVAKKKRDGVIASSVLNDAISGASIAN
ncbi:hypothetical protein [Paraburkholderia ginsengiterrae]|nr:hypothetical protein [Paraburkholderia ginsengiterrae]